MRDTELRAEVKEKLRVRMRSLRSALPEAARRRRSETLGQKLLALAEVQQAKRIGAFASFGDEVQTWPWMSQLTAQGKAVALPRCDRDDGIMHFYHVHDLNDLPVGPWGVPEPNPNHPEINPEQLDVIIVPALAVDPRGHRIGYGQGYYDRYLARCVDAFRICIAYDFQLIAESPYEQHDQMVDLVLTDTKEYRTHRR